MNIFEALRESHDKQRTLGAQLSETTGDSEARKSLYKKFKAELAAHAVAEERHLYTHMLESDIGVDPSRHAIAEHHALDEMIEDLDALQMDSSEWLPKAKALVHKVEHHLEEEENRFFQMAGKILSEEQKQTLGDAYQDEFREQIAKAL